MKRILVALLLVVITAVPAFAVFSSKGQIPNGEPVEYRGLKVTDDGVNITVINRSDKAVKFSATCTFTYTTKKNQEVGDFFIEELTLEPNEQRPLTKLFLKGDAKLSRKADSLRWTIYTLEVK